MAGFDVLDLLADDPIDQIDVALADRGPKIYRDRLDPFVRYDDREFRGRYRLSKGTARELIDLLDAELSPAAERNHALCTADKVSRRSLFPFLTCYATTVRMVLMGGIYAALMIHKGEQHVLWARGPHPTSLPPPIPHSPVWTPLPDQYVSISP